MTEPEITITVKLFAIYQEVFGVKEIVMKFPQSTPVFAVCERLVADCPQLSDWRNLTRFGVNLKFVDPDTVMQDGDEVVLIPPVSGG